MSALCLKIFDVANRQQQQQQQIPNDGVQVEVCMQCSVCGGGGEGGFEQKFLLYLFPEKVS